MPNDLADELRKIAPELTAGMNGLCDRWMSPLWERIRASEFRPKQINDAVWGTVELHPWEVALLDSPLMQRMRGVRQLGLANLVFPGAVHDRLEHAIGVVGAVERMADGLDRQIDRWNRDPQNTNRQLPTIKDSDRHRLRLAALFHDLGHGPFSHAIEPVLEVVSPLGTADNQAKPTGWRSELAPIREFLKERYILNGAPAVSEIIAVLIVMSDAVGKAIGGDLIPNKWTQAAAIQEELVACIIGAVEGPGADHLSAVISSQLDADRMDYLRRDAHHAGLNIGFDTDRLLSRLEILQIRDNKTPSADNALRERIARKAPDPLLQVGIAASGFGSFEQMLIGRTFLYDRLYHHHKVRAAEAMAQRMLLVAERDRGDRLKLEEIFVSVGDDTLVNIVAEEVRHDKFPTRSDAASALARDLQSRRLLHRAYAFRARFVAMPTGMDPDISDETRNEKWRRLLKSLDALGPRYELGEAIHDLALRIAQTLSTAGVEADRMDRYVAALQRVGAEQIIVDVPIRKADAIRILARYPDGTLKVPEFSFNPVKWADAYDLQKRTGYVFCPREVVGMVALASNVVFLERFGVVMNSDADGYIKVSQAISSEWIDPLVKAGILDQEMAEQLRERRYSLLTVRQEDIPVPAEWIAEKPHILPILASPLKKHLRSGLTAEALLALKEVLAGMFAFTDLWYDGNDISTEIVDEADLQKRVREHLRSRGIKVVEGSVAGGGKYDLFVADAVMIENKFKDTGTPAPLATMPAAGAQGRRYAISLLSQIVITVVAARVAKNKQPLQRSDTVEVKQLPGNDENRAEFRFIIPFGADVPSRQSA